MLRSIRDTILCLTNNTQVLYPPLTLLLPPAPVCHAVTPARPRKLSVTGEETWNCCHSKKPESLLVYLQYLLEFHAMNRKPKREKGACRSKVVKHTVTELLYSFGCPVGA